MRGTSWMWAALILAGGLCAAAPANAQGNRNDPPRKVLDDAGLFSADARRKANDVIATIKTTYKKDLLVETLEKGPPQDEYARWAAERFREHRVEGVYVVITKQPRHLQVEVGNHTLDKGTFTLEDRTKLRKIFESELGKNPDRALLDGVDYVRTAMSRNAPAKTGAAKEPPADHGEGGLPPVGGDPLPERRGGLGGLLGSSICALVCVGLVVVAGLWMLFGLIRMFMAPRGGAYGGPGPAPGYGAGPGYGGGGGGFFPSLLGGLFGAAGGMWLYNNVFGGHSAGYGGPTYSAGEHAPPPADHGAPPDRETDVGTGSSGEGGDWGGGGADAGAGADPGAGGGGDWGGGGGGGGDFGGGGGDWGGGGGGGGDFGGGGGGDFGGGGGGGDW